MPCVQILVISEQGDFALPKECEILVAAMTTDDITHAISQAMDLIHNLAGPATQEFGLLFGEKARAYRLRNLIDVTTKTRRMLQDASIPEKAVPPRLLLPLVENCSVEDDKLLQEKWAGLLATGSAEGDEVSPAFIETLKQLTPADARNLDFIYDEAMKYHHIALEHISPDASTGDYLLSTMTIAPRALSGPVRPSAEAFERLGLIHKDYRVKNKVARDREDDSVEDVESEIVYAYLFTRYAHRFIKACRGPAAAEPINQS